MGFTTETSTGFTLGKITQCQLIGGIGQRYVLYFLYQVPRLLEVEFDKFLDLRLLCSFGANVDENWDAKVADRYCF